MKTSELIQKLQHSIDKHGDLPVLIESSCGGHGETDVQCAVATRRCVDGDRFPRFTGDPYFLISSYSN